MIGHDSMLIIVALITKDFVWKRELRIANVNKLTASLKLKTANLLSFG